MNEQKILDRLHALGIPELKAVNTLNMLNGDYINLSCKLPNGETGKILDDTKQYLAAQAERENSERCYGVASDGVQLAVYEYGCGGADAELILWARV